MSPRPHPTPGIPLRRPRARLAAWAAIALVLPGCTSLGEANDDVSVQVSAETSGPALPPAPPAVEPREDGRLHEYPTIAPEDLPQPEDTTGTPHETESSTADDEPETRGTEPRADLDALRALDEPAEPLLPAAQQAQITNPTHARWYNAWGPSSFTNPEWEYSNKAELWDQIVDLVWEDAVQRYGDRLYDKHGTVWPGSNTSSYAVWGWSGHEAAGGYGQMDQVSVGLDPAQEGQRRPDVAVYLVQIRVTEEGPDLFQGELHRIAPPFEMSGELVWPQQTQELIQNHIPPWDTWVFPAGLANTDGWQPIQPGHTGG